MQLLRTSDKYDSCVGADIKCGMNIDARHASHFRLTREKIILGAWKRNRIPIQSRHLRMMTRVIFLFATRSTRAYSPKTRRN